MNKRNKIAKIHSELKSKETSLKNKIKKTKDELILSKLNNELYDVQYSLLRGSHYFIQEKEST